MIQPASASLASHAPIIEVIGAWLARLLQFHYMHTTNSLQCAHCESELNRA